MQLLSLIKRLLYKLGRSFLQLLLIVFIGLPLAALMLIFPALRRKLLSGNVRYENLSTTASVREQLPDRVRPQLDFLREVLQATLKSEGNPQVVYPLLAANQDKLDYSFIRVLQAWAKATLPEVEPSLAEGIAIAIGNFGILISDFPLGNTAANMEISLACHEIMLTVFTRHDHAETWANIQNSLGNAYSNRIQGDRADNIEKAIASYQYALEVRTKEAFPYQWAMTQNNLGAAYSDRIQGDTADNIEKAIASYQYALEVYTKEAFPNYWATTQNNLGTAYSNRIQGDTADNIEKAIASYQYALEVRTKDAFPNHWAMTQNNLGNAYRDRIQGDTADNIEKAIASYQYALEVYTKDAFPNYWATTQNNLGAAYRNRIQGDTADNIEMAIASYQYALEVYTKEAFPNQWAGTQNNLGAAYSNRIQGDTADNIEKAIASYQYALEVYTKESFPNQWATTQNNLGLAYNDRIQGDTADNIEKAIASYQYALEVRTKEAFPYQWAMTQNNLGAAYSDRIQGDTADNIEKAIASYQYALEVRTKEAFPNDWAGTQNNLGIAYSNRIQGDRADNIEKAIASYQYALKVYTKEAFPNQWATTMYNLGNAYRNRIQGDTADNIEKAIAAYQNALKVYTPETDPINCLNTSGSLGDLHFKQGNWQPATDAYQQAILAVERSRSWATTDDRRQEILANAIDVYMNIVQCFVNLKQYDRAIEYAERSSSRMLAELMASKDLYADAETPPEVEEYLQLQREIDKLRHPPQSDGSKQMAAAGSKFSRRDAGGENLEALKRVGESIRQKEERKQQLWRQIRRRDPVVAGQLEVDSLSVGQMQELIADEETAILSFYTTREDTYIFVLRKNRIDLHTCQGESIKTFDSWIWETWLKPYANRNLKQWRERTRPFLAELSQRLQLSQLIEEHLAGIKELIIVPHLYLHQIPFAALPLGSPPTPLEKGGEEGSASFGKGGEEGSVSFGKGGEESSVSFGKGGEDLGSPPTPLEKGGEDSSSPLLKGGGGGIDARALDLSEFDSPAPETPEPKPAPTATTYLCDKFRLRVIPSCQILSYCQQPQQTAPQQQMGIVENATGDLWFTGYECETIAQTYQVPPSNRLIYQQATADSYRHLAGQVQILHSSHHASANLDDPLESKLQLFGGEVTLGEILTWRLPDLVEVFLSCCETGFALGKLNDDILTIAAGWLCAGARNVVSTLWAVDDFATALFCIFYYQLRREQPLLERSEALRQAQFQLRELAGDELNNKYRASLEQFLRQRETAENKEDIEKRLALLEWMCQQPHPFEEPVYWSAFVSQGMN